MRDWRIAVLIEEEHKSGEILCYDAYAEEMRMLYGGIQYDRKDVVDWDVVKMRVSITAMCALYICAIVLYADAHRLINLVPGVF